MEFLHPLLALGAATFAVPVVIHLIFRLRKRRLVFSSLRFLRQSVLKESRRLRLREWILLLLRCAACVLIAMAFARPFRGAGALAGSGGRLPEDVVLVLDDSPSMNAQDGAGTRWQEALNKARAEINKHPSGDRVALVLTSEPARAEVELSGNFGSVAALLQREKPAARRGDLAQAMNTAVELLAGSTTPRRRLVVYSDFQSNQVDRGAWAALAQKAAAAGRGVAVELEGPPSAASAGVRLSNLAVTDVRAKSDVWIDGRPIPFVVRVANTGDGEHPDLSVRMIVDGKAVATRTVGLGPRSSTEIELSALFPRSGEIWGQVEVQAHDSFPDDDRRLFALRLRDSLNALVIEERLAERDSFLDEGYYVRMALDPVARGDVASDSRSGGSGYVQVKSIVLSQLSAEQCRNADLIILAGVTSMSEGQLAILEDAVRDGHNLVLFTGRSDGRLSEAFYNGPFWKNGLGLLPARPGPLYEGNRLEGKYHQLGEFKADHALFKPFIGESEASLRLPRFWRHYEANPADLKLGADADAGKNGAGRPAGEVLASFSDGSPMVMERPFGKGRVLMFNFAPRPEATELPTRKAFVPLLHQAVRHFAGVTSVSRRNLTAGDQFDFADAGAPPDAALAFTQPGKEKGLVNLTGKDHPSAEALGLYSASFQKGNVLERALWAVNLDSCESELSSESIASLRSIFSSSTAAAGSTEEARLNVKLSDEQKALAADWRYYLLAACCCLLLEVWLRDFWLG